MDSIEQGRAAWDRLKRVGQTSWEDWVLVATALETGREQSLRLAQTNKPHGKKYTAAMRHWLDANGFGEMIQPERQACHRMFVALPAITAWRDSLPEEKRRKINHPDSGFWGWKRSISAAPVRRVKADELIVEEVRTSKKVFLHREMIRRAAIAMADSMRDPRIAHYLALAETCLKAAIRDADDVDQLYLPPPKPAAPARPAAVPLHAPA